MVDIFDAYPYVVTPSGSCATMVKLHTPELLADDPAYAAGARSLADKTYEFGQFMTEVVKLQVDTLTAPTEEPITFHYSCHLRHLQTPEQAARLVRDMRDIDYRPLERIDQCCGFGGAFGMLYPRISNAMVQDKLDCIERTGASIVVCNEVGCGMTIEGAARRRGLELKFIHVAELWAESLGLMDY